jgi:hypothetical protein
MLRFACLSEFFGEQVSPGKRHFSEDLSMLNMSLCRASGLQNCHYRREVALGCSSERWWSVKLAGVAGYMTWDGEKRGEKGVLA